jgi:hypothetical protein
MQLGLRAVNPPVTKGLCSAANVELQAGARCTRETTVVAEADTTTALKQECTTSFDINHLNVIKHNLGRRG